MSVSLEIKAIAREDAGKGASRRLRRAGLVPGIVYGGGKDPEMVSVKHNELIQSLDNEAFYSSILTINVDGGKKQSVVLKDLQRHPAKPFVTHFDLLRVADTDRIKMNVPLHFVGEDVAPGVKLGGGVLTHNISDLEIICAAQDLPEYLEVDISAMEVGDILHLTDLKLPEGVEIVALTHGEEHEHDTPVVALHQPRVATEEEESSESAGESGQEEGGAAEE